MITAFVRYSSKILSKIRYFLSRFIEPLIVANGWSINVRVSFVLKFLLTDGIFVKTDGIFQLKSGKKSGTCKKSVSKTCFYDKF